MPVTTSLPFHAAASGTQTSKLIIELGVGVACAVKRQNAGRLVSAPEPVGV